MSILNKPALWNNLKERCSLDPQQFKNYKYTNLKQGCYTAMKQYTADKTFINQVAQAVEHTSKACGQNETEEISQSARKALRIASGLLWFIKKEYNIMKYSLRTG